MILRLGRGLNQLVHNMLRRRVVGIAHPKINNILTRPARLHFHLVQGGKKVGGKPFNTWKFHKSVVTTS